IQQAPKKVKVSKNKAKIVLVPKGDVESDAASKEAIEIKDDVENDPPSKEAIETKKQKTGNIVLIIHLISVHMSVSLHGPVIKGISTAIETVKIVIPNFESLEDVWEHFETNFKDWEPASWDRTKLHYTEAFDHADTVLTTSKKLEAAHANKCLENPDGCLHETVNGMTVHLQLTVRMRGAWVKQITAGTPGVDLQHPPTSLDSFNLENYKPAQSAQRKWSQNVPNLGPLKRTHAASGNLLNVRPPEVPPPAVAQIAIVPQTVRFFGRAAADAPISQITGKLSFEESDTIASLLFNAGYNVDKKGLVAWEMDADRQFLFDGKLKSTLTSVHTDIFIKAEEAPPALFKFH
ncbi:hypothetical protein HDU77_000432, partial [Chytriomyces hyalinus]